jgi:hypothetical protein
MTTFQTRSFGFPWSAVLPFGSSIFGTIMGKSVADAQLKAWQQQQQAQMMFQQQEEQQIMRIVPMGMLLLGVILIVKIIRR